MRRLMEMAQEDERETRVEYRGTGFYVGVIGIMLFALILLILAVQNTQEVEVHFLGFDFDVPLFGIAIGAALIAVIIEELIGLVWRRRRRTRLEERAELERLRAGKPAEEGAPVADEEVPTLGEESPRVAGQEEAERPEDNEDREDRGGH